MRSRSLGNLRCRDGVARAGQNERRQEHPAGGRSSDVGDAGTRRVDDRVGALELRARAAATSDGRAVVGVEVSSSGVGNGGHAPPRRRNPRRPRRPAARVRATCWRAPRRAALGWRTASPGRTSPPSTGDGGAVPAHSRSSRRIVDELAIVYGPRGRAVRHGRVVVAQHVVLVARRPQGRPHVQVEPRRG